MNNNNNKNNNSSNNDNNKNKNFLLDPSGLSAIVSITGVMWPSFIFHLFFDLTKSVSEQDSPFKREIVDMSLGTFSGVYAVIPVSVFIRDIGPGPHFPSFVADDRSLFYTLGNPFVGFI